MASLINNAVFTAASGGTGAFGVSAALTGYQTPAAAGAVDGKTYRYRAESGDKAEWEIGTTVASSTATSFTRVVTASSAGGTTTVNFTNPPTVAIVPQAADILQFDDTMSLTTTQQAMARKNISAPLWGYIVGLIMSNNGSDLTNDIDISAGHAADSTALQLIPTSGMTKRLDAGWSAGTGNGMRNSGAAITNTTYHIYLVSKANGVDPDFYAHTSTTVATVITALQAESGGASYIYARRIGSIIRSGGTILAFRQYGDIFKLATAITDRSSTSAVAAGLLAVSVPSGIKVQPMFRVSHQQNAVGNTTIGLGDGDSTSPMITVLQTLVAQDIATAIIHNFFTNTSAQINFEAVINSGTINGSALITFGWIDTRGRD